MLNMMLYHSISSSLVTYQEELETEAVCVCVCLCVHELNKNQSHPSLLCFCMPTCEIEITSSPVLT